jgi:hypothetical protein
VTSLFHTKNTVEKSRVYEGYSESKDTSPVIMQGIFFFRNGSAAMGDRNHMTGQSSPATVTATLCSQCVFKMAMSIQNPAKSEVHTVIRFLCAKGETAAEIRQLVSVYGEDVMNRQNMTKWCRELEAGRSEVHYEMSGRPSVATDEIIQTTDENIRADRRLIIYELHQQ